jgi:hypothetical protein
MNELIIKQDFSKPYRFLYKNKKAKKRSNCFFAIF